MDEKTCSRVFEPFFTTKQKDKGTGLGLATVYGIVKQSGGYIWVYSKPDCGTSFEIYLPMVEGTKVIVRPVKRTEAAPPSGVETILVVEDDRLIRDGTCDVLRLAGYTVLSAGSPDEALHLAANHQGIIDFLLTDMSMPRMNGRELVVKLSEMRQEPKVLYVSGYTDVIMGDHAERPGRRPDFLQKPYTRSALICKVRAVLDAA